MSDLTSIVHIYMYFFNPCLECSSIFWCMSHCLLNVYFEISHPSKVRLTRHKRVFWEQSLRGGHKTRDVTICTEAADFVEIKSCKAGENGSTVKGF